MSYRFLFAFLVGLATSTAMDIPGGGASRIAQLKDLYLRTELVAQGQARAVIVRPRDAEGAAAAARLATELTKRTGVQIPVVVDESAIREDWGQRNLIVVGRA